MNGPNRDFVHLSTVDLWTFIVASSSYGETVTILVMGKDGFGVSKDQFKRLNGQIQCRGIQLKLIIGQK